VCAIEPHTLSRDDYGHPQAADRKESKVLHRNDLGSPDLQNADACFPR
jgi:hypothetical protein